MGIRGIERGTGHEPAIKDRAEQRGGRELGIRGGTEIAAGNALRDEPDQWPAGLLLETVMEAAEIPIALGGVDQRGNAGREGRADDDLGDLPHDALDTLAGRA